jgi:hypothetical protein
MSVEWRERSLYERGHAKWVPDSSPSARRQPKELEQKPVVERTEGSAGNGRHRPHRGDSDPHDGAKLQQPNLYLKQSLQQKQEHQRISQFANSQPAAAAIRSAKSPERIIALVADRPPPLPVNRGSSARPSHSYKYSHSGGDGYETRPELVAAALKRRMKALQQEKGHMEYYLQQAKLLDSLFISTDE